MSRHGRQPYHSCHLSYHKKCIISQDHDLETMYLDSFLKLSCLEGADISDTYMTLKNIGEKYHVTFVLSISLDAEELPECAKGDVIISL